LQKDLGGVWIVQSVGVVLSGRKRERGKKGNFDPFHSPLELFQAAFCILCTLAPASASVIHSKCYVPWIKEKGITKWGIHRTRLVYVYSPGGLSPRSRSGLNIIKSMFLCSLSFFLFTLLLDLPELYLLLNKRKGNHPPSQCQSHHQLSSFSSSLIQNIQTHYSSNLILHAWGNSYQ
jgi:hypothetical protein